MSVPVEWSVKRTLEFQIPFDQYKTKELEGSFTGSPTRKFSPGPSLFQHTFPDSYSHG
jgi:hypothetical protein